MSRLQVTELRLERFQGLSGSEGFTLQNLTPGLNILTGPNGSGKTTSARAIQSLLWPPDQVEGTPMIGLQATWEQQQWVLALEADGLHTSRDGEPADPPAWSPPENRHRYAWALSDLLTNQDIPLARQVAREMAGGVDFEAVAQALDYSRSPSRSNKLRSRIRDAKETLQEALRPQRELMEESRRLETLEDQRKQQAERALRLPRIETALELQEKQSQLQKVKEELDRAPPTLARVQGDDARRCQRLIEKRDEASAEINRLERELSQLQAETSEWTEVEDEAFRDRLRQLRHARERVRESEQLVSNAETEVAKRTAQVEDLRSRNGLSAKAAGSLPKDYEIPEFRQWITQTMQHRALSLRIQHLERETEESVAEAGPGAEDILRARRDLADWLNLKTRDTDPRWITLGLTWAILLGTLLYMTLALEMHWTWGLLLLPSLLAILAIHYSEQPARLRALEERVPETIQPSKWTIECVQELQRHLDQLEREVYVRRRCDQDREKAAQLRTELEAVEHELHHAQDILRSLGIQDPPDETRIPMFLADLRQLDEWTLDLLALQEALRLAEQDHERNSRELETLLSGWPQDNEGLDVDTRCENMQEAIEQERERRRDLQATQTELERHRDRFKEAETELSALCERTGLKEPDVATLTGWTEMLEDWRQNVRESENLSSRLSELRNQLKEEPGLVDATPEALEALKQEAREAGDRERELADRISRLKQNIETSSKSSHIHEATENLQRLKEELREERDRVFQQQAGMEILDWAREQSRTREQPEVLRSANEFLERFTNNALGLSIDTRPDGEEFLAAEPGHPPRPLASLSSGERAQVLMAVRLAFLRHHETVAMPLFVDEALGTSDPARARLIMHSLLEVAGPDRQVFVLTAQDDEVKAWKAAATERNQTLAIHDLQSIRFNADVRTFTPPEPVTPIDRSRQHGESMAEWAQRIGVPAWSPRQPIEDLHLWYLCTEDDTDGLGDLLAHGITTWGALKAVRKRNAASEALPSSLLQTLSRRAAVVEAEASAWRIGRPGPVPPEFLKDSDAVSERFLSNVLDIHSQVRGQGTQLLDELENKAVSGFRQNKISQLRDELHEHGFLPTRPVLSPDERRAEAADRLARLGLLTDIQPQDWQVAERLISGQPKFRPGN